MEQKRFLIIGLLVLCSLLFLGFFRESESLSPVFQGLIVSFVFFLVIPLLSCKIVLKEPLKNLGWQKGNPRAGLLAGLAAVGGGIAFLLFLDQFFPVSESYAFSGYVESDFLWFILYEVLLVSFTTLLYEVFFRGFIQTLWLGHLGIWAVGVQAAVFIGLFFLSGEFAWHNASLLLFSPLAGLVAYFSGSIRYSWAASWLFFFLTDIFFLILR